jgi:glutamate synthase (NADPH/NADH) large chain/glutamate synthase (ferredoxin)
LKQRAVPDHPKANSVDLSRLLVDVAANDPSAPRFCTRERNDGVHGRPLDDIILQDAKDAITEGIKMSLKYKVKNTHRSVGTKVSGEIGYQYGKDGLPEGTLTLNLQGSAGQSLGTFLASGLRLVLTGEANDYVGKGMSAVEIIVASSGAGEVCRA